MLGKYTMSLAEQARRDAESRREACARDYLARQEAKQAKEQA